MREKIHNLGNLSGKQLSKPQNHPVGLHLLPPSAASSQLPREAVLFS